MSVCLVLQESIVLPKETFNRVVNVLLVISVQLELISPTNSLAQYRPFGLMLQQKILDHALHVFLVITVHILA